MKGKIMELNKKEFEMPEAEVIIFDIEDVIATSVTDPDELPGVDPF